MTVALVTCSQMPKPDLDEPFLRAALDEEGLDHEVVAWDDPDVDWSAYEVTVLRTPWDYTSRLDEFLPWVLRAHAAGHVINPPKLIEWNHHKGYLFDLERAGVPIVPTRQVAHGAPFPYQRASLRRVEGEVVIKPAIGIGAFGAARLESGSEEAFAHLEALSLLGDVLIQPLVPSIETQGEVSLIHMGNQIVHAVRKVPAPGDFRVQDHHGGTVVEHEPTEAELAVAADAIREALNITGSGPMYYARVDLVDLDGPRVMELELIEPELFLRHSPRVATRFADIIGRAIDIGKLR